MKKLMTILVILLISSITFAQNNLISYVQIQKSEKRIKGTFTSYETKEGVIYNVGDTLKIGTPSTNKTFAYITMIDIMGTMSPVKSSVSNTNAVIRKIRVGGTKRMGWFISLQTQSHVGIANYFISLENAILYGEVNTGIMTSDEALIELKKWKDKYDLELITEEEYNKKKEELSQLIK